MSEVSKEQIDQIIAENQKLRLQNEDLASGLKDLTEKFSQFSSSTSTPEEPEFPTIPTESYKVKVDKKSYAVKFLVPKFRLSNEQEVTALEASTDNKILEQLIRDGSGVIQIVEE